MPASPYRAYLDQYAEPIVAELEALPHHYHFVIVIPLYNEPLDCLEQVLPADLQDTLVIVVVNAAELDEQSTAEDLTALQTTQAFLQQFYPGDSPLTLVERPQGSALLIVDCCSKGRQLPLGQGVGLARKIGGDLAVACIDRQIVQSPWIHCTDADVELPPHYLGEVDADCAVAIYPFRHAPLHRNIVQYEISLRYYVQQLATAGSPYAFQTIGSLLKINARHYVAVRGFPKRRAAEDFYMLNKLAKTGKVVRLKTPVVTLSSRISARVPFGTGAAMGKLSLAPDLQLYHPAIFGQLRTWLGLVEQLWCDRTTIQNQGFSNWWPADPLLLDILLTMGVEKMLQQANRQCHDLQHFRFFLWSWFDAFRTLKFIHAWRDANNHRASSESKPVGDHRKYQSQPIRTVCKQLGWMPECCQNRPELSTSALQHLNNWLTEQELQFPLQTGPYRCLLSQC